MTPATQRTTPRPACTPVRPFDKGVVVAAVVSLALTAPAAAAAQATVVSRAELEAVADRIRRGVEPQASAYSVLLADAEAAQAFEPDPPATMHIMGGYEPDSNLAEMRAWLWRESNAAYASALASRYGGDVRYAEKAREILDAWASAGTVFTGGDRGLQLGSFFSGMLYAADLLDDYPAWTREERELFESWWRAEVLVHTHAVMSRANNWGDAGLLGVLAAAVVFRDDALLLEGIERLDSYFEGEWKIRRDDRGTYLPAEVTRNDGTSGITYTAYAFTTMVQALEIARYAGFDFWRRETTEGASLEDAVWWFFRWNNLAEPFPWSDAAGRTTSRMNTIEIASNHFAFDPAVGAWLAGNRPVVGRQGDAYATLNKGDLGRSADLPEGCVESSGGWRTAGFEGFDRPARVTFEATPSLGAVDGVMGLSRGPASGYDDLAAIVRFNPDGLVDARDGDEYTAEAPLPYERGTTYRFRLEVGVAASEYDAFVRAGEGAEEPVGRGLRFRTPQQGVGLLDSFGLHASTGSVRVCGLEVTVATEDGGPGEEPTDAGADGGADASSDAGDAGLEDAGEPGDEPTGCACRSAPGHLAGSDAALPLALLVLASLSRGAGRRGPRRPAPAPRR